MARSKFHVGEVIKYSKKALNNFEVLERSGDAHQRLVVLDIKNNLGTVLCYSGNTILYVDSDWEADSFYERANEHIPHNLTLDPHEFLHQDSPNNPLTTLTTKEYDICVGLNISAITNWARPMNKE